MCASLPVILCHLFAQPLNSVWYVIVTVLCHAHSLLRRCFFNASILEFGSHCT